MIYASDLVRSEISAAVRQARGETFAKLEPPALQAGDQRPARKQRLVIRLWLPLTPLWILLAPFAVLAAPILAIVPATRGVPPFRAAFAVGAALLRLSGTVVQVESPAALIRIRIL